MLTLIKKIFEILPSNAPEFIYTTIFKPKPILNLVNWIILKIIPENIVLPSGRVLFLNKKDPVISCALALGVYEKFETILFQKEVRIGMTVVDIGANIGYYTIIAGDLVGPKGKVFCFEPDSESVEILRKNIEVNKFKNVECINKALSNKEGSIGFFSSIKNRADNRIYDPGDGRIYTEVETTTLDSNIPKDIKIDLIKMDIQGAEALAISGMEESIKRIGKTTLITEFWPDSVRKIGKSPEEFLEKLISLGFDLYNINGKKKRLEKITDTAQFTKKYRGREFANIIGYKN